MFSTIKNAFKIPDLRKRIFFTILMLIIFRFGAHIPVPYLSADAMKQFLGAGGTDLFSLFDVFTGGAFSNATVMAMGVSPYINASIIVQLLTVAIPALERLAKEGQLMSYIHEGFWQCMANIKEKTMLEKLLTSGKAPWKRWERTIPNILY